MYFFTIEASFVAVIVFVELLVRYIFGADENCLSRHIEGLLDLDTLVALHRVDDEDGLAQRLDLFDGKISIPVPEELGVANKNLKSSC